MEKSNTFQFPPLSRWLHWLSMLLLFALFAGGSQMVDLPDESAQKLMMFRVHGIVGLVLVLFTIVRIVIRLRGNHPLPEGMTEKWNIWLHGIIQWATLILLLGLGVSGMTFLGLNHTCPFSVDPAKLSETIGSGLMEGHEWMARLLLLMVVLHVAGVMRHQLTRSNVLLRMGLKLPLGKR